MSALSIWRGRPPRTDTGRWPDEVMKKPYFIARQGRRLSGLLGHIVARVMARETRTENDRTLELLELHGDDDVFEIGLGHGATLYRAAQMVRTGHLAGADLSEVMVNIATPAIANPSRRGVWNLNLPTRRNSRFVMIVSTRPIECPYRHLTAAVSPYDLDGG
jgi:hypothetical protein